jgi:hypothetical protein
MFHNEQSLNYEIEYATHTSPVPKGILKNK